MMTKMAGLLIGVPQVSGTPYRGPDQHWIALSNSDAGECAPVQAVKQSVTLESFNHWEASKMLLLSDELWQIISVALLILLSSELEFFSTRERYSNRNIIGLNKVSKCHTKPTLATCLSAG